METRAIQPNIPSEHSPSEELLKPDKLVSHQDEKPNLRQLQQESNLLLAKLGELKTNLEFSKYGEHYISSLEQKIIKYSKKIIENQTKLNEMRKVVDEKTLQERQSIINNYETKKRNFENELASIRNAKRRIMAITEEFGTLEEIQDRIKKIDSQIELLNQV